MSIILLAFQPGELSAEHLAQVKALAPDMTPLVTQDRQQIEAVLDEIEIAVCSFPRDLLAQAANLRWFHNWGAGVDWLPGYPALAERDLIVTNASGVHAIPISEHILAFLLAFGRGLPNQMRRQIDRNWGWPERESVFELAGKTMLVIGLGAIGTHTARLASALGMRVWGIRRHSDRPVDGVEALYGPDKLHECLPGADFVVLTVPLTVETVGMIGEAELCLMKPSAYLVNIGRGATVREEALVRALQGGWIAGAGLDVVETEPLPESSPLWGMENVIITAHYAGFTPAYTERGMAIFLDNLKRYQSGQPLRNVVDKRLGY